jgi:hypothetical protein
MRDAVGLVCRKDVVKRRIIAYIRFQQRELGVFKRRHNITPLSLGTVIIVETIEADNTIVAFE